MRGRFFKKRLLDQLAAEGGAGGADGAGSVATDGGAGQGNAAGGVDAATVGEAGQQTDAAAGSATQDAQASTDAAGGEVAADYTDFRLPEGMAINPQLLGEFKTTLAGLKLSQEQAQLVADLGVKQANDLLAGMAESGRSQQDALAEAFRVGDGSVKAGEFTQPEFIRQQAATWADAVKADKELGGERLAENLAVAKKALNALGSPELQQLLDKSGLGSHPDLVRAFYRAGRLISEDTLLPGSHKPAAAANGRTAHEQAANRLYGK